ncbi:hypothetical protein QE152_g13759 [Popillia japonica]|uniref:Uncharacterized protein n=1 Tax=Popillia japonica TaxID=7064 RepID=A0AAW1L8M3_POPJA
MQEHIGRKLWVREKEERRETRQIVEHEGSENVSSEQSGAGASTFRRRRGVYTPVLPTRMSGLKDQVSSQGQAPRLSGDAEASTRPSPFAPPYSTPARTHTLPVKCSPITDV